MNFDKECEEIKAKLEDINTCLMEYVKGYADGYDDAAKDPKAWYVLDKKGEQVHIGDTVKNERGRTQPVFALGDEAIIYWLSVNSLYSRRNDLCEKVKPDSREKIKEELAYTLSDPGEEMNKFAKSDGTDIDDWMNLAEQFISRIESLGGE